MDPAASKKFLEESLSRLRRMQDKLGYLPDNIVTEESFVFIPLASSKTNRTFVLRAKPDEEYPMKPADYTFVNPADYKQEGVSFWPNDNGQAFKHENPPWICMSGTLAWTLHGHPNPGMRDNLMENVAFSIFVKINK